jgi:hypothetical protein
MTRFMTIDRMQNYFVVVIRAWKDGGASRLLHFGVILTEEELRATQLRYQVVTSLPKSTANVLSTIGGR